MLKWLWLSVVVIALDQWSKHLISDALQLNQIIELTPFLNLVLVHNSGAAFSFLSDASGWQRWFFVVLAVSISIVLVFWIKRLKTNEISLAVALSLILGGAVGNLWDRLLSGYVIDFIDVYYGVWHWPAFNVADSAITVGVVVLFIDAFLGKKKTSV